MRGMRMASSTSAARSSRPRSRSWFRTSSPGHACEKGVAEGFADEGAAAVGVEEQSTDPSQVGWYEDHQMSSVVSVALPGGQLALVFALAGEKGAYGIKGTAEAALPKLPIGAGGG